MTELDDQNVVNRARNKKRFIMVAPMMLFLAPVVAGWLWKPDSFRNRGNLIEPPVALSNVSMTTVAGGVTDFNEIFGKWTYVLLLENQCLAACQQVIDGIERARISLGKNEKRVRLLAITFNLDDLVSVSDLVNKVPKLMVLAAGKAEQEVLTKQFKINGPGASGFLGQIYLVDPRGNLMMSYPLESDPKDLHKDIGRLLRAPRIG